MLKDSIQFNIEDPKQAPRDKREKADCEYCDWRMTNRNRKCWIANWQQQAKGKATAKANSFKVQNWKLKLKTANLLCCKCNYMQTIRNERSRARQDSSQSSKLCGLGSGDWSDWSWRFVASAVLHWRLHFAVVCSLLAVAVLLLAVLQTCCVCQWDWGIR